MRSPKGIKTMAPFIVYFEVRSKYVVKFTLPLNYPLGKEHRYVPVWKLWRKEKSLAPGGNRTLHVLLHIV